MLRFQTSVIVVLCTATSLAAAEPRTDRDVAASGLGRVEAYEPIYAIVEPHHAVREGDDTHTNIKFQFSFAYPVVCAEQAHRNDPRANGLYLAYTQTSFWDLHAESKPFYDTSYKPEGWFHLGFDPLPGWTHNSLEFGYAHESNGRDGDASRSINRLFLRTIARWEIGQDWYVIAHPRVSAYRDDSDNPDMSEYRGYFDLMADIGQEGGFKAALWGRVADSGERGSLQTDLSWPLSRTWPFFHWDRNINGYIYFQSYIGYAETLLSYTQRSPDPRFAIGYALVR
jgi:phospholipase A1